MFRVIGLQCFRAKSWMPPNRKLFDLHSWQQKRKSPANLTQLTWYPCWIRAHPWLEKDLENQPRIHAEFHGCEPRSISALFTVGLLPGEFKPPDWSGRTNTDPVGCSATLSGFFLEFCRRAPQTDSFRSFR